MWSVSKTWASLWELAQPSARRGPDSGLRLASCVTLGQLLHLSEPWFPHELWKLCKITQRKQMVAFGCSTKVLSSLQHHNFPGGSDDKESTCSAGDPGLIPGSGRSPGEGNCYPLQYSCLESSKDRGTWWATVHWVAKSRPRLSD